MDAQHGTMPIKDLGSFVATNIPSDADIKDHRSQDKVYIGLHLPKQNRHRHKHRRHHKRDGSNSDRSHTTSAPSDATSPAQRVQFLLGEEEDEEHKAHDVFCEMAELLYKDGGDVEWKETARWVKFEEDVEEGGERWSKPHVATLSLHSLFELRCNILQGTVILDMAADSLPCVVDVFLDNMVASKQLEEPLKEEVRDILLLRHRHLYDKKHKHDENGGSKYHLPLIRSFADIGRKYSEPRALNNHELLPPGADKKSSSVLDINYLSADVGLPGAKSTPNFNNLQRNNSTPRIEHHATQPAILNHNGSSDVLEHSSSHKRSLLDVRYTGSSEHATHHDNHTKLNMHFMKKIPKEAEAANILVGEVDFLNYPIVGFTRLLHPQLMGDLTEVPVPTKFIFFLLGPKGNQNKFHEIGRSIATLMSDEVFHDVAYHARNREDLLAGIDEFLDQVTVLPPGEWDPSIRIEPPQSVPSQTSRKTAPSGLTPSGKAEFEEEVEESHGDDPCLQRTGRFFGGLIDDVKRKVPFYGSDFKDVLHVQCIASFVFLYFACLTPIITFGGLLGDATNNNMAAFESILAGAICGVVYALCAGQPLTILGSTGPVLVFETITFQFCHDMGLDYLELRFWIGMWTGLILIVMTAFDLSALVRYITRFTEESFALLISLIFIKEAIAKVINIKDKYPINFHPNLFYPCDCLVSNNATNLTYMYPIEGRTRQWSNFTKMDCNDLEGKLVGEGCIEYKADVFFLSILLFIGTFTLAYSLKSMRNSAFFPSFVRSIISDFAVLIAIMSMVAIDAGFGLGTPKLEVPDNFAPTKPGRAWVINPVGKNPWWTIIAAIVPSLLATILIFMDQQITAVIVNRKENKLKKGKGYHLDLFIVALLIMVCSLLGLPWFVAATVLSINHVMSLKQESECTAPGERPKFLGVREQRVTGITIFFVIGMSVLLTSVLKALPMPVLYGVFLYMGVSSLRGMQVVDRMTLWFMPQKYQPDFMYLRHVRTARVHIFTVIQVLCLACLWVIKTIKSISIAFPLMVLAMCFVRKGMDWVFSQNELKWLDDIMPESHSRAKEDAKKQEKEEVEGEESMLIDPNKYTPGHVNLPLQTGSFINIPVDRVTVGMEMEPVNISEEMAKTTLWKTIVANESSSNLQGDHAKYHKSKSPDDDHNSHGHHKHKSSKKNKMPVQFYIDDEEKEQLLEKKRGKPAEIEIVVDPPSTRGSICRIDEDTTC
ncbi:electroneutral sodium bicarbonate exchanger 1-like isoform X2 [Mizuhopecten yessoensis]|uniref:electroneutral sodium bicarbonate exchanger 1-like isoform X2 n=1 Tax=Mizuhopecten yessoensis TaxID=6573 RepID=UPI000B45D869|nr:electroneutral sodium bicarbonate exchanger 1-like isoform X2 [Mizuhopecten yessoensis]